MILLNSLAELGMHPCGACRALVSECEHWRPPDSSAPRRRARVRRQEQPAPDIELTGTQLHRLAESVVQRSLLADTYAHPRGTLAVSTRAARASANRLCRMGLLELRFRGGDFVITDAGRNAYEKILQL